MRHIENPAGIVFLDSLVRFVENKNEVKKVIAEINKARDEANTKIAAVGKISEIGSLRKKVEAQLAEANTALVEAKREAGVILGRAGTKASAEKARQKRATEILRGQAEMEEHYAGREKRVTAREEELQAQMNSAAGLQKEATALKATADELIAKAERQLAAFQGLAAQLN